MLRKNSKIYIAGHRGMVGSAVKRKLEQERFGKITNLSPSNLQLSTDEVLIEVDTQYFRPTEVEILLGDAEKAKEKLGWEPEYMIDDLVKDMIEGDFKKLKGITRIPEVSE